MSAPKYDDPKPKLKMDLRPFAGSETIFKWASALGGMGSALCIGGFVACFIPGVQGAGNPLWFLFGAGVLAGFSGIFYLAKKIVRRWC
jgi:hypothetical protein